MKPYVVTMFPVGDPLTGEWCDHCLLPSAVEGLIAMTDPQGNSLGTVQYVICMDCGR